MFLHERDAYPDFADILHAHNDLIERQVVHCFTGEKAALYAYLDLDCYIGITGWICDERRGTHLLQLVKDIPADRLLIETDAPYLAPEPHRGKRCESAYVAIIAQCLADTKGVSLEEIARVTTTTAERFFRL